MSEPRVVALPPGEHRLSPVGLHLEVEGVLLIIALQGMEPHRITTLANDQRSILAQAARPWLLLRGDEDVTGGRVARLRAHLEGGRNSGRERKAHGCSPRAGEAIALARGLRSQPKVLLSVIQAPPAATAPRNLCRVILLPNRRPFLFTAPASLPKVSIGRCLSAARHRLRAARTLHRLDCSGTCFVSF